MLRRRKPVGKPAFPCLRCLPAAVHPDTAHDTHTAREEAAWAADPDGLARARAFDRSAGRWCGTCGQHGSHHSDRHGEFARPQP